jgi:hypothetical protein
MRNIKNQFVSIIGRVALLAAGAAVLGTVPASAQRPETRAMLQMLHHPQFKSGTTYSSHGVMPEITPTPFTGTIEVVITITLKTPLATGNAIYCTTDLMASTIDSATAAFTTYHEDAWSTAKVTGSTATCTVTTPYSWALPAASSDITYVLSGNYDVLMEADQAEANQSSRTSLGDFVNVTKLPAAGTTSKYTVAVTL